MPDNFVVADHRSSEGINLVDGDELAAEQPGGQQRQGAAEAVAGQPDGPLFLLSLYFDCL
jgi:hypothetical protein